ncbi:MAG: tail fiber protein [Spirochaetales bacterium]|nr:tail fiber protein [Spirochaetales bacterium]
MAVKVKISEKDKVVGDVLSVGMIATFGDEDDGLVTSIYTGSEWLPCDGSAVSTETYKDLFTVIGYRFGKSGDDFNLPNANPTLVTDNHTFAAFVGDTVVAVKNASPITIDISAGAGKGGTRVTIIHQQSGESVQTLTITTGTNMTCVVASKGELVLVWDDDGKQWCLVGETVRMLEKITTAGLSEWITPFAAVYKLSPVGGGGGGGGANPGPLSTYAGGGAGGSSQQLSTYISAGTTLYITMGSGGSAGSSGGNGGNGGETLIAFDDGTSITLRGMGGGGGGGASNGNYGAGGIQRNNTDLVDMGVEIGTTGRSARGSSSGEGGNGACGAGRGGAAVSVGNNGRDGGDFGGGGSGGAAEGYGASKSGGAGAPGAAYIEY